jgi:hypothetical protein
MPVPILVVRTRAVVKNWFFFYFHVPNILVTKNRDESISNITEELLGNMCSQTNKMGIYKDEL